MVDRPFLTVSVDPRLRRQVATVAQLAPRELAEELSDLFGQWGEEWHRLMVKQFRPAGGRLAQVSSRRLANRTGALRRSLRYRVKRGKALPKIRLRAVSAGVIYANQREFGGPIQARRVRNLTIPQEAMKTAAGVTRESARSIIRRRGLRSDSEEGELEFFRDSEGRLFLWEIRRHGEYLEDPVPLFFLTPRVLQPGPATGAPSKLGFFRNWRRLRARRNRQLSRALFRSLKRAQSRARRSRRTS